MRAFLVFLVLLVAAAVAGDRVAERLVTDRAEQRLVADGLVDPQLTVEGFPFLTQLLSRRLTEVRLTAAALQIDGARAEGIRATAHDVDVPADGPVSVGRLRAGGLVTYGEVLRRAGLPDVSLDRAEDGRVRLRGEVTVLGQTLPLTVLGQVEARGRTLTVRPESFRVGGDEVDPAVSAAFEDRFALTYPLRDLPPGIEVRRVTARPDGFRIEVVGTSVSLSTTSL